MSRNIIETKNTFNDFLKHEKMFSEKYLKSLQIVDERFDCNDYSFLELFFNKKEIINKIYSIIDDLIKDLKFEESARFLAMGDFLFAMTSYDLSDPANIAFKTSRNSYIGKIKLRAIINQEFSYDFGKYLLLHKKLLIGLRLEKIVKKTQIKSFKNKKWETVIYFEIILSESDLTYKRPLGASEHPFILTEIGCSEYSIASFRNIWKAKRRKREMESFKISYKSIIKANQTELRLSSKILDINRELINEGKNKILHQNNCKNIDEYFKKIIELVKDSKYSNKLLMGKEQIENVKYNEIFILKMEIREEYIEIMKNFQKIFSFFLLNQKILDKNFYLPAFMDNRGRQYYWTLLSPTFYIIFRYLYEFAKKKEVLNLETSVFYQKILNYAYLVKKFELDEKNSYFLIILFIEIGKFFAKPQDDCFLKTEDMIKSGIKNYENKNKNLKFEDLLYVQKIYQILEEFINNKSLDENTIIFKDATASGLQNYGILLGYKKNMLKYLNLDNEDWCDTYQYIINKFLKSNNELKWESEKINNNIFKRKHWKSTIMTIPYNAEWFTCFTKLIKSLREDGIEYKKLSEQDKKQLKNIHKTFYDKIKKDVKKEFYEGDINDIIIFKYNKWITVSIEEYKINYKKARDKYSNVLYMLTEDEKGTKRALEANNMHYRDAELVKNIIEKFEIIPIHDCFGVRLSEIHLIMDEINLYYSKKIGLKTYSIHVIK